MIRKLPGIRSIKQMTPQEQTSLLSESEKVAFEVENYATRYGFSAICHSRIWPLTVMLCASFRGIQTDGAILVVKCTTWIFSVDDFMDEPDRELKELETFAERCACVTRGDVVKDNDHRLLHALKEIRGEFSRYASWSFLQESWADSLCQMYKGMCAEGKWCIANLLNKKLPIYEEYIQLARWSIGVMPVLESMLVVCGDPTVSERKNELTRMMGYSALAIRLSNDLRSEDRERAVGQVNAVSIREKYGQTIQGARDSVHQSMKDAHSSLLEAAGTARSTAVGYICNATELLCEFYSQGDYHLSELNNS